MKTNGRWLRVLQDSKTGSKTSIFQKVSTPLFDTIASTQLCELQFPSEMEVAPRYTLFTLFKLFTLFIILGPVPPSGRRT